MIEMNQNILSKKIIIMGLDNSGKTSILLSLQRNTNLLSFYSLNPTRGLDIVKFMNQGANFNIWDFGGQEQYHNTYFERLDEYLTGIDKFIFVIDIQDVDRYDLALQYLKKIIIAIEKKEINVEISIFLHKFDPDLENEPEFTDEQLKVNLISKIQKIIPSKFSYGIFKTTIYTVFQKRPLNL